MMIVEPVILRPLTAEWEACKAELTDILSRNRNRDGSPGRVALSRAELRLDTFMKRLDDVRVLDPACGSGNFLYLAMQGLKDLERRAIVEATEMGLAMRVVHCGPHNVKGIEINTYAAELARTSIWIGNIQWLRRNGFEARKEPVLEDLDAIECRDAIIAKEKEGRYEEAHWPEAEYIVGNPPFLGGQFIRGGLGDTYFEAMTRKYSGGVVPGGADLVTYWFEKHAPRLMKTNQNELVSSLRSPFAVEVAGLSLIAFFQRRKSLKHGPTRNGRLMARTSGSRSFVLATEKSRYALMEKMLPRSIQTFRLMPQI